MSMRGTDGDAEDGFTPENLDPTTRMTIHERICAVRYHAINARLGRIEKIIIGATGSLLIGMAAIIARHW